MRSSYHDPLNLSREEMVSINQLVAAVARVAGKTIRKLCDLSKPQGVRGRNSDNSLTRQVLGWEPKITLEDGLQITYGWIQGELRRAGRVAPRELAQVSAD